LNYLLQSEVVDGRASGLILSALRKSCVAFTATSSKLAYTLLCASSSEVLVDLEVGVGVVIRVLV
jgi:hypothetical protein